MHTINIEMIGIVPTKSKSRKIFLENINQYFKDNNIDIEFIKSNITEANILVIETIHSNNKKIKIAKDKNITIITFWDLFNKIENFMNNNLNPNSNILFNYILSKNSYQ